MPTYNFTLQALIEILVKQLNRALVGGARAYNKTEYLINMTAMHGQPRNIGVLAERPAAQ